MVVISETAGAAGELGEAVIVNATDRNGIAEGIRAALEMPEKEENCPQQNPASPSAPL